MSVCKLFIGLLQPTAIKFSHPQPDVGLVRVPLPVMLIQHSAIRLGCGADLQLRYPFRPSLHLKHIPLVPIRNAGEMQVITAPLWLKSHVG
eukprot:7239510-Prorocentrum_lima.AAC.1